MYLASCSGSGREGVPPRHVVLITVDTLSASRMSSWGHSRATTDLAGVAAAGLSTDSGRRSLDQLANEGVLFARAFAPRGMTFPSMATVFTGRPPMEHGSIDNGNTLCDSVPTLAASFSQAGFDTAAFTANPLLANRSGIERGFDSLDTSYGSERDLEVVTKATAWLRARDLGSGAPFFLWLHLMGPHMPYEPEPLEGIDYRLLFTNPNYAGTANGSREFLDDAYRNAVSLSRTDIEHVRALYDGEVARADHLISLFVEVLSGELSAQPVNVLDDCLLIFAADHGEELHQRGDYWAHSKSLYDTVLHVPLFFRHPESLTARRVMGEIVELQDLMPTLLDWFELPIPSGVRGRSLLPLLDDRPIEPRAAFAVWQDQIFSIRTEDWRYVWNPDRVEPTDPPAGAYPIAERALYNVRMDPFQLRDVLDQHPEIGAQLEERLRTWVSKLNPICTANGEISPERRRELEKLGYFEVQEPDPRESGSDEPNPSSTPPEGAAGE